MHLNLVVVAGVSVFPQSSNEFFQTEEAAAVNVGRVKELLVVRHRD